jgi:hypothetical protein
MSGAMSGHAGRKRAVEAKTRLFKRLKSLDGGKKDGEGPLKGSERVES